MYHKYIYRGVLPSQINGNTKPKKGDEKMRISEIWESECYEIDFSDFSIEELESLESYISLIIAYNRRNEE